jgi:hypothetical protein
MGCRNSAGDYSVRVLHERLAGDAHWNTNGDYVVRIITFNSPSTATDVSLYPLHLQLK